jgi:hypothetical protein
MANPITENMKTGTIGELLVQLRLLQHGVQAAPPLKDSGNDLVALKGYEVRTIQVKTSTIGIPQFPNLPGRYHLLALVRLHGHDETVFLDDSDIYLIPKDSVANITRTEEGLAQYRLTSALVEALFNHVAQ